MFWQTSRFQIPLDKPLVMGIVNLTPDSFSLDGHAKNASAAIEHCEKLVAQGAHILDIGAESSRPGAEPVSLQEELDRLLPVVKKVVALGIPISVDTYKPEIMRFVLDCGVDIINDIRALRYPSTTGSEREYTGIDVISGHPSCGVCLMHMHLDPLKMQVSPMTGNVLKIISEFFLQRTSLLKEMGVTKNRIVIDPGIGFGKTVEQNFSLLAHQIDLVSLGYPLLAGWSRKSSLFKLIEEQDFVSSSDVQPRMVVSVAAALIAVIKGAAIVRVHEVKETVEALRVWSAVEGH